MKPHLKELCRICLDKGIVDMAKQLVKVPVTACSEETLEEDMQHQELTVLQMHQEIFTNSMNMPLELNNDFPMICNACLDEFLTVYAYFQKLTKANDNLKELLTQSASEMFIKNEEDEDYLVEYAISETADDNIADEQDNGEDETIEDENNSNYEIMTAASIDDANDEDYDDDDEEEYNELNNLLNDVEEQKKHSTAQEVTDHDSLIVSEFLPSTSVDATTTNQNSLAFYNQIRSVDYAAIEVKYGGLNDFSSERTTEPDCNGAAVYMCKYCPQAFSGKHFLLTHVRRTHVCKYCTKAFQKNVDLNRHIKEQHQEHKCAICGRVFNLNNSLRAHLKRVHKVQLPAHVVLLDYKPADVVNAESNNKLNSIDGADNTNVMYTVIMDGH